MFFKNKANQKYGNNNKDDVMKQNHSTRKEQKFEHRGKRKKYRKNIKYEEINEGHSSDNNDNDNHLRIYVTYIIWNQIHKAMFSGVD